ncbi:flagellar filament capping protein FliD [Aquipseudomonas alcaligenes]|uniref:flagellar filament capping protein FliD n=1 Tax=Aquipseudomonas alcaligenes TaxID=43263 RepID=UPI003749653B
MATIDSDYIQQMASQLANYEVQAALTKNQRTKTNYQTSLDAVTKLDSALKSFRTSLKSLSGVGSSMLVNSATFGQQGYATASVGSSAQPGNYQFFVKQLASSHQLALEGLTAADVPTSGSFTIGQGSDSFSIDLAGVDKDGDGSNSLEELAAAINGATDNSGVKASLVRSNGQVSLVLSAEESGADNAISLSTSAGGTFATSVGSARELSKAQDAIVYLGGEGGMELSNSSNTFTDMIDGVSLTFSKVHASGEAPLSLTIGQDPSATKTQVQKFVDAFNGLMSTFDSLTASGSETASRGPLAGDASIRSIENMLNQAVRSQFGGKSLIEFGIAADRNGKLSIDTARLEKAVAADPEGFEKLFGDKNALLDSIDKNLNVYVTAAGGVMASRKESLNLSLKRNTEQLDLIEKQYDTYYNRYLKQYTSMAQIMASMEQTAGLFA